jgi:hypothetical protein
MTRTQIRALLSAQRKAKAARQAELECLRRLAIAGRRAA